MSTLPQRSGAHPGDGLGYHVLGFDKKTGDRLEMLRVRAQFGGHAAFESALRDRFRHLAVFGDPAFARVRQIDRLSGPSPSLVIVSQHVFGVRLTEVLSVAESFDVRVDTGTALGLVRQLTAAIATLHAAGDDISHGCIGPERLLLTADGRLIVTEYILGSALEAMEWSREKFWYESRIALPASGEPAVFDRQTDIMQIGLLALALLEGRTLYAERRYPLPLAQHVAAARETPLEGPSRRVSTLLTEWLARALLRDRVSAFTSIDEALTALDQVIDDGRYDARASSVAAFITRCRQASPDLTPRELDPTRDAERLPHFTPEVITPAPVPSVPAPIGMAPAPQGAAINLQAPSRPAQTPATIDGRAPLDSAMRTHPPVHNSEPIEFVAAIGEFGDFGGVEDAIAFEPSGGTPAPAQAFTEAAAEEMNSVLDMEVFVGMVHQQQRLFVVQVDRLPVLLVDPVRRSYWLLPAPLAGAAPLEPPPIGETVARLRRGSLRYRDARTDDPPATAGLPIEPLLWNLGTMLQPEDLLPQVKARAMVQLTRWPNFGRIRSNHAQLKMSAQLTSRAIGIDDVFEALGEPRPSVIAFLNACALCGLFADVTVDAPAPSVAHLAREGRPLGGLMQRLRGALGIGRA